MGMVVYRIVGCLWMAACSFHPASLGGNGGTGSDASMIIDHPDGADAPADCAMWHAHHFNACAIPAPSDGITISGATTFSTDTGSFTGSVTATPAGGGITQSDSTTAYLISIQSLAITSTGSLRVIGAAPLVVASWGDIDVMGSIDAGSTAGQAGAGANPASCTATKAMVGVNAVSSGGSGGGGGGGFNGMGGNGGIGDDPKCCAGGSGGGMVAKPTVVLGGCAGAISGQAGSGDLLNDPTAISTGGAGGGALQLTSKTKITILNGTITSGGEGGGGAPDGSACGGGGGGAGGFLGFDAPMIEFDGATIAANGGGGGGSAPFANTGAAGEDGQESAAQATGGALSTCSEAGMLGGAGAQMNGGSSTNPLESCGGAGGGGGVGYILTWGMLMKSNAPVVSPMDQPGPP